MTQSGQAEKAVLIDDRTYNVLSVKQGGMGRVWMLAQAFDEPFDPIYRRRIAVKTFDEGSEWPDAVRTLVCMDNLLWLFEQRAEPAATESLSELVCALVGMTNNLLRKQEGPPSNVRRYTLDLLGKAGAIADLGKGQSLRPRILNS